MPLGPNGGRIGAGRPVSGNLVTLWFALSTVSKDPLDIIPDFLCNFLRNLHEFLSFLFDTLPDCFSVVLVPVSQIAKDFLGFFRNLGCYILYFFCILYQFLTKFLILESVKEHTYWRQGTSFCEATVESVLVSQIPFDRDIAFYESAGRSGQFIL